MHNNADTLTEEEIVKALYTLKDNEFEAPVRWDLLQIQPPHQLITKPFILEYMRIECNFDYKDSKKEPGDPASGQTSVSDEQPPNKAMMSREQAMSWLERLLQQMEVHERYFESIGEDMAKAITLYLKLMEDKKEDSISFDSSPETQLRNMFVVRMAAAELLYDLEKGRQILVRGADRKLPGLLGAFGGLHVGDGAGPSHSGSKRPISDFGDTRLSRKQKKHA